MLYEYSVIIDTDAPLSVPKLIVMALEQSEYHLEVEQVTLERKVDDDSLR